MVKPYRNQNETPQVESLSSHASFFESTLKILLGLFTSLGKQKLLFFESTVWLFLEFDRILRLYKRTNVRKVCKICRVLPVRMKGSFFWCRNLFWKFLLNFSGWLFTCLTKVELKNFLKNCCCSSFEKLCCCSSEEFSVLC